MRTVDFQGTQLSSGQRRRLADQKRLSASMPNVIAQQAVSYTHLTLPTSDLV